MDAHYHDRGDVAIDFGPTRNDVIKIGGDSGVGGLMGGLYGDSGPVLDGKEDSDGKGDESKTSGVSGQMFVNGIQRL